MNLSRMIFVSVVGALMIAGFSGRAHATTARVHVDKDVTEDEPTGQGDDWGEDHAYKFLQDGLDRAAYLVTPQGGYDDAQVWVAEGTYYPDEDHNNPSGTGSRNASFYLLEHVQIYGGFNGTEDDVADRDVYLYETILSGDIGANGSYHVVYALNVDTKVKLSGFTITGGQADMAEDWRYDGGGMLVRQSNFNISLCTFKDNSALFDGGAVFVVLSSYEDGGTSGPTFHNCIFFDNTAEMGGAVSVSTSNPNFANCLFYDNAADNGSESGYGGAMRLYDGSDTTLLDCTFSNNEAADYGGALLFNPSDSDLEIVNCIFWGNTDSRAHAIPYEDPDERMQISKPNGDPPGEEDLDITYSCVQDDDEDDQDLPFGGASDHIIDDDPEFKDAGNDNYRLCITSPCIEEGDLTELPPDKCDLDDDGNTTEDIPFDLDLLDRVMPDANPREVDMGAYEFRCYADANEDCSVDVHDLTTILNNWGDCDDPCPPYCTGDVNHDCTVDADDLQMVLDQWGCGEDDPGDPPDGIDDCIDLYADDYEELKSCIDTILLTQGGG